LELSKNCPVRAKLPKLGCSPSLAERRDSRPVSLSTPIAEQLTIDIMGIWNCLVALHDSHKTLTNNPCPERSRGKESGIRNQESGIL